MMVGGDAAPIVDVNLLVHNSVSTVGAAIESVLAQTWPAIRLTLIDNASTDGTFAILQRYADAPGVSLRRNRVDTGGMVNCQRAFWHGDADYVMPKTGDDIIAPDFIERVMDVMLRHADCAMCHAGGLIFTTSGGVSAVYPPAHNLAATDGDPLARARHVMSRYTSAPSFWGIYRRQAIDALSPFAYGAGWDHAVLAELALYGEIRHLPEPLYWRRDGGRPVDVLARASSGFAQRGLGLDDWLADLRWHTPLITTAYGHVERFALARLPPVSRLQLMADAVEIFRARWLPLLLQEAAAFAARLPLLLAACQRSDDIAIQWRARQITDAIAVVTTICPEMDFARARSVLAGQVSEQAGRACVAALSA
ncbi:MAG: glycosyltransferase family 2 protein [Rhodospirillales bacterium]|nr:glycosyltransferase family 2 protein [Rhodospirillales bacterium]